MKKKWMKKIPIVIGISLIAVTTFSGIVMLLWNGALAPVLHISAITIWQAMGILILSKILFGGFRGRGHFAGPFWKRRMFLKWQGMTPGQREEWRSKMQGRCGGVGKMEEAAMHSA